MYTVVAHKKYLDFSPVFAWARDIDTAKVLFNTYKDAGYAQTRLYEDKVLIFGYDNPELVKKQVKDVDFSRDLGGIIW